MLQFLKSQAPGKSRSFSYIEGETSLHPHLSLWENLQLEAGAGSVKDYTSLLRPEHEALFRLLKTTETKANEANYWENFITSFLKAITGPSMHLLVDINEQQLSPILIQQLKKNILTTSSEKVVFIATANTSLWLDCAHTIVKRNNFDFVMEELDADGIIKHWAS